MKPTAQHTRSALDLALCMEFDRASLGLGSEAFFRLTLSVPQALSSVPSAARRGLALAISLDCSGSMNDAAGAPDGSPMNFSVARFDLATPTQGRKIEQCKMAVLEAIELLGPDDMASLSAFSSMAKTLFPMSPMTPANKEKFKTALTKIKAGGGTALQAGWSEAGREAVKGIDRKLLCRVVLLTDGEATDGERNAEALAAQSAQLAFLGVSTSCFGVGSRFNEDLLCAMANAGEGNFRYIPDAMLASAAAVDEVNGLGATVGRKAKLRLIAEEGIETIEILNSFDADGDWKKLPTLLAGRPIEMVAKLKTFDAGSIAKLRAEVVWINRDGIEQTAHAEIQAALIEADKALALPQDTEVAGVAAALTAASAKTMMANMISQGNLSGASSYLESARSIMGSSAYYSGSALEMASLDALTASFNSGDMHATRKNAVFQSYSRSKNQTVSTLAPQAEDPTIKKP